MSLSRGLSSNVARKEPSFAVCTPGRMACSRKQRSASLLLQQVPAHTDGPHSNSISARCERMLVGSTAAPACMRAAQCAVPWPHAHEGGLLPQKGLRLACSPS